jgi:6-phosphofructokinase 1
MASKRIGLIVGGGPAPGINGVISAVTLEALSHQGWDVLGFREGFRWLVRGDTEHIWHLTANDVRNINLKGGSILGTARVNPTKSEADMARVVDTLKRLNIDYLVTIGGDDTAFSGSMVYSRAGGSIRVAHVPKTIDNDLPLPPSVPHTLACSPGG